MRNEEAIRLLFRNVIITIVVIIVIYLVALFIVNHNVKLNPIERKATAPAEVEKIKDDELYYYESKKAKRYRAYQTLHPEMSWEDVVWRVNVELDKANYEDPITVEDVHSLPLLVNKHYKLPDSYVPKKLVETSDEEEIREEVYDAYKEMLEDMEEINLQIYISSGYRSIASQEELYSSYVDVEGGDSDSVDEYASRAGHSEHHTGNTIDVASPNQGMEEFGRTDESDWIDENAYKYGFIVRYTEDNTDITGYMPEPWHLTFVGKDVALSMYENKIGSLEEYYAKYIQHKES